MIEPTARIHLVRHGRSAHVHREGWIDVDGVDRWYEAYDRAGIDPDDPPPATLLELGRRAGAIVASDKPRTTASAEVLAAGAAVIRSPDLREIVLQVPRWLPLRMPLGAWALAIGAQWMYDELRRAGATPDDIARADRATAWLGDLAREHRDVIVVTHAAFRRLLATRLVAAGWRAEDERRSHKTWSAWALSRYE